MPPCTRLARTRPLAPGPRDAGYRNRYEVRVQHATADRYSQAMDVAAGSTGSDVGPHHETRRVAVESNRGFGLIAAAGEHRERINRHSSGSSRAAQMALSRSAIQTVRKPDRCRQWRVSARAALTPAMRDQASALVEQRSVRAIPLVRIE